VRDYKGLSFHYENQHVRRIYSFPNATPITEKSGMLSSDSKLRQVAGWTPRSIMHHKYVHFRGNESEEDLLRLKGIIRDDKESVNILAPKICPFCKTSNTPNVLRSERHSILDAS
jgi:hypothetical protein